MNGRSLNVTQLVSEVQYEVMENSALIDMKVYIFLLRSIYTQSIHMFQDTS